MPSLSHLLQIPLSRDVPTLGMNRNVKSTTLVRVCSWVYWIFCGQKIVPLGGLVSQVDKNSFATTGIGAPRRCLHWTCKIYIIKIKSLRVPAPAFEWDPVAPRVSRWSASEEAGSVVVAKRNDKRGEGERFHVHEVLELIVMSLSHVYLKPISWSNVRNENDKKSMVHGS